MVGAHPLEPRQRYKLPRCVHLRHLLSRHGFSALLTPSAKNRLCVICVPRFDPTDERKSDALLAGLAAACAGRSASPKRRPQHSEGTVIARSHRESGRTPVLRRAMATKQSRERRAFYDPWIASAVARPEGRASFDALWLAMTPSGRLKSSALTERRDIVWIVRHLSGLYGEIVWARFLSDDNRLTKNRNCARLA
jgi:hypothetical protein